MCVPFPVACCDSIEVCCSVDRGGWSTTTAPRIKLGITQMVGLSLFQARNAVSFATFDIIRDTCPPGNQIKIKKRLCRVPAKDCDPVNGPHCHGIEGKHSVTLTVCLGSRNTVQLFELFKPQFSN